ncbi:MAG: type VI secretion system baseplate subunit TssG [Deltaproteobacteria bacterium]|nr:type VI secretion system baseplate subunit TssG [Deltaproteobacteria bacterium]
MAGENRGTFSDLKLQLLKEGHSFSFFQVMRLLRLFVSSAGESELVPAEEMQGIRVRPKLSLDFPAADVDGIEERVEGEGTSFQVTATFLGLYGSSSPLPTFYTEDLMDEASSDESITREFLDVFNHRLYLLLFKAWNKYRQFLQVVEERNENYIERLFCLLGLGEEVIRSDIPGAYGLLRYIGLFTQFPRSAAGLNSLLRDALGDIAVEVLPCMHRMATIPEDQRLFLGKPGAMLGEASYLGDEIPDRMGKFRLHLGPVKRDQFQGLLPGGRNYEKLTTLTSCYVTDPLEYDVEVDLAEGEACTACLGASEWARLGLDTWVFGGRDVGEVTATFYPEQ